jgi:hypothetical protein
MGPIRWHRLAPLTGVVAVILWVIGVAVLEAADAPDTDARGIVALVYFTEHEDAILAGTFVFMLGAVFFLWFVAFLRAALYRMEGSLGTLASAAYAGGIATGTCGLLLPTSQAVGALNNDNLSPSAAQTLLMLGDLFFYAAELAAAVLLIATAIVILRARAWLPVWLAWVSLVIAIVLLIPPIGWAALLFGVTLWTILVGLLLYVKAPPKPGPPPLTTSFVGAGGAEEGGPGTAA